MPKFPKPKKLVGGGVMQTKYNNTPGGRGFSATPVGIYNSAAPRVGGVSKPGLPLKGATRGQMKLAKSMVRPGTGSGAKKRK